MFLEHLEAIRHLYLLAHDQVGRQRGVLLKVRRGEELLDHPVAHLLVVAGDRDERGLNEAALDADQGRQRVELTLDFVDCLALVGDHSEDGGEVA